LLLAHSRDWYGERKVVVNKASAFYRRKKPENKVTDIWSQIGVDAVCQGFQTPVVFPYSRAAVLALTDARLCAVEPLQVSL
jgi:hypothetical protein